MTRLGREPWPNFLIVNLTEDLRADLTVDRRQVDPPAKTVELVLDWTRKKGGAALATWSAPEFFALYEVLMELDPKVTSCADGILRKTARPDMIMKTRFFSTTHRQLELSDPRKATMQSLEAGWSRFIGLSDLDPEILFELLLVNEGDDYRRIFELEHRHELEYKRGLYRRRREYESAYTPMALSLRASLDSSIDPVVIQGLFHRTKELADAGLVLPNWLQHAVSFETCDKSGTFPAAYRPLMTALDPQRQIGLAARWTSDNSDPVLNTEDLSRSDEAQYSSWSGEALSRLNEKQRILISEDLDGVPPFLTNITPRHFLEFSRHPEIKTFVEAAKVARSLADLGIVDRI